MQWADRIGRRVKLRDLHILIEVAQWGSMAKAAERLAISHPVVSKTISSLEHALGVRLFDRSAQGVELTMYGRALLKSGVAVFDEMRQGIKHIEFLADPTAGDLRFGCPEAMAAGLMQVVTQRFWHQYPNVVLEIVHADTVTLHYRELRERNVEFLVGRIKMPFAEDDLTAETLLDERLVVVAGKRSRWARQPRIDLAKLVDEPWVLPPFDSLPGSLAMEVFGANALPPPKPRMITLSLHLLISLVATGRFLSVLPGSMLEFGPARTLVKALPVKFPRQQSAVGILTLKNRTLSPLAERFIACLREVAQGAEAPIAES